MIFLNRSGDTNTVALYPEVSASYVGSTSGSYSLQLIQDYDQSTTTIPVNIINTPTRFSPRIILQFSSSLVPEYSGMYTSKLLEATLDRLVWGTTNVQFGSLHQKWGDSEGPRVVLDTDRALISGSDTPTYSQYNSPQETGAYTTYHQ